MFTLSRVPSARVIDWTNVFVNLSDLLHSAFTVWIVIFKYC